MRYLADTSILSTMSPFSGPGHERYRNWVEANAHLIAVPTVAVTEIEQGVRKLFRLGFDKKANQLTVWIERLLEDYSERIVEFDLKAARIAGVMTDRLLAIGKHPGVADVFIAATAEARGLTVVTRNLRHFAPIGVPSMDPVDLRQ